MPKSPAPMKFTKLQLERMHADSIERYIRTDPLEALYQLTLCIHRQKSNNIDGKEDGYIERLEQLRRIVLRFISL